MIPTLKVNDPGLFALRNAVRAAIVAPLGLAVGLEVLDLPEMGLFAAFGGIALLVFVDFGGPRRTRLFAYAALAAAGAALIAVGTLCSREPWLAAGVMFVVAFVIMFAGVLDGYVSAAQPAAILAFVLAAMLPGGAGDIPERLAGWGLAAVLAIAAIFLLWPGRPRDQLRTGAAAAARALAAFVEALARNPRPEGDPEPAALADDARAAITGVRQRFVVLPHRPSGTGGPTAALGRLIEDLGWLSPWCRRTAGAHPPGDPLAPRRVAVEAAIPPVLRAAAAALDRPREAALDTTALDTLIAAHRALGIAFLDEVRQARPDRDEAEVAAELAEVYRLRQVAWGTLQVGRHALQAAGRPAPALPTDPPRPARTDRLRATGRLASAHASMRSVWLRNSVRGALGLAVAVLIAQLSDLQHGFWVVLGTMSVLRSAALTTGSTIVQALGGTTLGIVLGGLIVAGVGDHRELLWALLPLTVGLGAYAPRAISFFAGQAAFTVVVLILFNLIDPVGWRVGLVRVEDVAIGCAVSLAFGVLLWPRGAGAVLREAAGDAYTTAAACLDATIAALLGERSGADPDAAAREATLAAERLDDTVREYLGERTSARHGLDDLTRLVAAPMRIGRMTRVMRSAAVLVRLHPVDSDGLPRVARAHARFTAEWHGRCDWYDAFGTALAAGDPAPAPEPGLAAAGGEALRAPVVRPVVLDRAAADDLPPGLALAWAQHHLDVLHELEPRLHDAAPTIG